MHSFVHSYIPSIVLVVINSLLIYEIAIKNRKSIAPVSNKKAAKNKEFVLSILLMTIFFIVLTVPITLTAAYTDVKNPDIKLVMNILDCMSFSFNALNFCIFLLFNKKFFNEFKELLKSIKKFMISKFLKK